MKRLVLILLLYPWLGCAQGVEKLEKKALKYFYTERHFEALNLYNQILGIDPNHTVAKYRAEICSLLTDYRSKSLDIMLSYAKTQGKKDKFYNYWMGRINFGQNNFKKAIKNWEAFLALKTYKSKEIIAEAEGFIQWAKLVESQFSQPENYEIEHLHSNVNSEYTEYSPVYFREKEELLFLSSKPINEEGEEQEVFHVFQALRNGNSWSEPEVINKFGDFTSFNANIEVVSNDGRLFLYQDENKGSLYYSELKSGTWTDLIQFDSHLTGKTMDSHFFINEHEDRILFAAPRRRGAFENLDIFESYKDPNTGKWTKAKLMSENINSDLSEDYPYLTPDDQVLYFSSRGHGSIGGYDVFKSEYDMNTATWSAPESLNYPVNTQDDDIQFKIDTETNSGYLVSDRFESKGSFDIFFFHESDKVFFEGTIVDLEGNPVDNAVLVFTPKRETNLTAKISTDDNGHYRVKLGTDDQYKLDISFQEEIVYSVTISTPQKGSAVSINRDFNVDQTKQPLLVDSYDSVDSKYTDLDDIGSKFRQSNRAILRNIYFAFGSHELSGAASEALGQLFSVLKENPKLRIELSGHTDNIGSETANLRISQKRAEEAVSYLIRRGIEKDRMVAKGYGQSRPLASNDDGEDGRELNRRIEVMVIE